jgi:hypothetical protein
MREDARLGLIAVIGALVLFAWDRRGEQLARVGDVVARTPLASNWHALREFWARAPADALGVKQEFEKTLAQNEKPTT